MIADLAAMTLGATPFSIYLTSAPDQVAYVIEDAGARRSRSSRSRSRRSWTALVEHVLIVGECAEDPGFDAEPHWRAVAARRHPHADLHQRHDRAAEGRPDRPPQPDGGGRRRRAARRLPGRLARDQLAAQRPRRRAHRAPLPADRLRDDDHHLPRPAPDRRLPAGGQADLVLRRAARVGEAQGRRGGQARRRRGRAKLLAAGIAAGRARAGRASRSRPQLAARSWTSREAKLFAPLRAAIGLDEAKLVNVGAAPTPREVLVFFHAIGVPLAEIWGMSRDLRRGRVQPGRADQDRHRRAALARASSSSWPTTASCSRARRS